MCPKDGECHWLVTLGDFNLGHFAEKFAEKDWTYPYTDWPDIPISTLREWGFGERQLTMWKKRMSQMRTEREKYL